MLSLLFFIIYLIDCEAQVEIKDGGTSGFVEGDIAVLFYVTLQNNCNKEVEIYVSNTQCVEPSSKPVDNNNAPPKSVYLIGGYMGILHAKDVKNVTLIYPNLYLQDREAFCNIEIKYKKGEEFMRSVTKDMRFSTNKTEDIAPCATVDMDAQRNCAPVDCVLKYSGEKSFFSPNCNLCDVVPCCVSDPSKPLPETGYSLASNNCTSLNDTITKMDLELLEANQADVTEEDALLLANIVCHHGDMDNSGQCICHDDWRTTVDQDEDYQPTLMQYHMCNIETSGWNQAYRDKIQTTILIIGILALTIASKIIIIMCLLNWCYRHFRKADDGLTCIDKTDSFDESLIICEAQERHSKCICKELPERRAPMLQNQTVNVSYYPLYPSSESSVRPSAGSIKQKDSAETDKSIALSHTTSSSMAISFRSDSEDTTEETNESEEEEDYEIQFSEEEEEVEEEEVEEEEACECEQPVPCKCEESHSTPHTDDKKSTRSKKSSGSNRRSHRSGRDE